MIKKIYPFLLGVGLVLLDQAIKWWVANTHPLFVLKNQNTFFGWGPKLDLFFWLTFFLILILALSTIERRRDNVDPFIKHLLPLNLMLAGVLSNLIDRIFKGAVIDYLKLPYFSNFSFNLADILIIIGAIIYAVQVWPQTKEINENKILRHK